MNWQERCPGWLHDDKNIKGFFGEYRWLSNFHLCSVRYNMMDFPSSENAYQAAKCKYVRDMKRFLSVTPSQAKRLGESIEIVEWWGDIKQHVMYQVLLAKFLDNPDLKRLLRSTWSKYLEETNWWYDEYWGVCKGKGENNLGKLLMQVRTLLI